MSVNDPIADMLTRIRNAYGALHKEVSVPKSKMKESITGILKEQGFVNSVTADERNIVIDLKYDGGRPGIAGLKRISSPGRRVYVDVNEIPQVQNGLGICILSTSKGVLDGQAARDARVGGELLCEIW